MTQIERTDKRRIAPQQQEDWATLTMLDGLNPWDDLPEIEGAGTLVVADFPPRWKRIGTLTKGENKLPIYQMVASEVAVAYDPIQGALLYLRAGQIDKMTDQRIHVADLSRVSIPEALALDQAHAINELADALERRPRMRARGSFATIRSIDP